MLILSKYEPIKKKALKGLFSQTRKLCKVLGKWDKLKEIEKEIVSQLQPAPFYNIQNTLIGLIQPICNVPEKPRKRMNQFDNNVQLPLGVTSNYTFEQG